jgi:formylglycine-generating enzyme
VNRDGLAYIKIPAGGFDMGCLAGDDECDSNEKPLRHVTLSKPFWIGETEVTVGAFKRFKQLTELTWWHPTGPPTNPTWKFEDHPVVYVTLDHSIEFCKWAGGRLPTEAEWEYAARGGRKGQKYPWGNEISHDDANYQGIGGNDRWDGTAPVAKFKPNGFGLYDMAGNVQERIQDWFSSYDPKQSKDPLGPSPKDTWVRGHVSRGGSWRSRPQDLRTSSREPIAYAEGFDYVGFRCVLEVVR